MKFWSLRAAAVAFSVTVVLTSFVLSSAWSAPTKPPAPVPFILTAPIVAGVPTPLTPRAERERLAQIAKTIVPLRRSQGVRRALSGMDAQTHDQLTQYILDGKARVKPRLYPGIPGGGPRMSGPPAAHAMSPAISTPWTPTPSGAAMFLAASQRVSQVARGTRAVARYGIHAAAATPPPLNPTASFTGINRWWRYEEGAFPG